MATPAAEIRVLASLLDELDYYDLLSLDRGAPASRVREAYHAMSRRFHPDTFSGLDPGLRGCVERIAKRVTEAYSVLRNPRRRQIYDQRLKGEPGLRLQLVEAEAQADRKSLHERLGATPNGRRFFTLAHQDIDRGDLQAAARNLQMALTFEPRNSYFKEKLEELRRHR
jgi:DnaJ-class molecular chaperone